jgi:hypothetical protein
LQKRWLKPQIISKQLVSSHAHLSKGAPAECVVHIPCYECVFTSLSSQTSVTMLVLPASEKRECPQQVGGGKNKNSAASWARNRKSENSLCLYAPQEQSTLRVSPPSGAPTPIRFHLPHCNSNLHQTGVGHQTRIQEFYRASSPCCGHRAGCCGRPGALACSAAPGSWTAAAKPRSCSGASASRSKSAAAGCSTALARCALALPRLSHASNTRSCSPSPSQEADGKARGAL